MDTASDLSCKGSTGQHAVDSPQLSCNRKVVGSNPTSGSKTAGQSTCTVILSRVLLASLIIPCV